MATSKIQIWNIALTRIGVKDFIVGEDEASDEASVMKLHHDLAVEKVLSDFPWPFAIEYKTLGMVEENPNDEWMYSYRYPHDCVFVRRILTPEIGKVNPNPPPFAIGSDNDGRLIFTDREDAAIAYTKRVTDAGLYSVRFIDALSWYLAWCAAPLSRIPGIVNTTWQMYSKIIREAASMDGNEQQQSEPADAEHIRARA